MFDPQSFMNASFTEANDTVLVPCPEGEFIGVIQKPEIRPWNSKDGSKSGLSLDYYISIDDPKVTAVTGRNPTKVKGGCMLDLTEGGALDFGKGKNVGLGRLREACDLNRPGAPFSFNMFEGKAIRAKVGSRAVDDRIYDEVKGVAKL
jgi:hypothetical protein